MGVEARKPWPIWVLLPLAVLGPPILGIGMVWLTPRPYSATGNMTGFWLFPWVSVALIAFAATKA